MFCSSAAEALAAAQEELSKVSDCIESGSRTSSPVDQSFNYSN